MMMMAPSVEAICVASVCLWFALVSAQQFHRKFEYKYSFKGPYLAQKDGSVPFWAYGGSTIASEESVRITPSLKSKKGSIWTKNQTNFEWWEIEFVFRVTGRGRIGADGLAFWFTESPGVEGPVFGSSDRWKGLGLFFDSFDNDNKHNNPFVMAMVNDGTMNFDHPNDGSNQQLAGCLRDYRNKAFPVRTKVEYYKNTLTVLFHGGMSNNEQDYELCLRAENVFLPRTGFFGLSAATGGLADDHDVLKFLTFSLTPLDAHPSQTQMPIAETEKEKLVKEFEEYRQKLEQQKEQFRKDHPDEAKEKELEGHPEEWFETDQQRELRQIFMGQSQMFDILRELHRKMDEIIGRQERTLSLVSAAQQIPHQGNIAPGQVPTQGMPQPIHLDTIRRPEVEAVLNNQMEIVGAAREIKAFVTEIHQKTGSILSNQGKQSGGSATYDVQGLINEMRDGLNVVKKDLTNLNNKNMGGCPQVVSNCLSTTVFIVFVVIELILILGYFVYRDNKEAQAKKFY